MKNEVRPFRLSPPKYRIQKSEEDLISIRSSDVRREGEIGGGGQRNGVAAAGGRKGKGSGRSEATLAKGTIGETVVGFMDRESMAT